MYHGSHTIGWLVALALAIPGPACRTVRPSATGHPMPARKTTCFNARDITSFVPLPGPFVYVRVGNHEHYLLTLDRSSDRLRFARNIVISPDFDRVCSGFRAPLSYEDRGVMGVYNIVAVESVRDRKAAEALARKRTSAQRSQR